MTYSPQRALDSVYRKIGEPATYQPLAGGDPVAVRVLRRWDDTVADFGSSSRRAEKHVADIRVSDVAVPVKGDQVTFDGETYQIQAAPLHPDTRRLEWRLDLLKV